MHTFANYANANAKIKTLSDRIDNIKDNRSKEIQKIEDYYLEKIDTLRAKKREKTQQIISDTDIKIDMIKNSIDTERSVVNDVERKLRMIDLIGQRASETKVYQFSRYDENGNYLSESRKIYFDPIDVIWDSEYTKIYVYIVPNDKPKNKYSLILRGYSIFTNFQLGKSLLNNCKCGIYIRGIHEDNYNICVNVKDAESEEKLKKYYDRNNKKIMAMLPDNIGDVEKEFETAKDLYKEKDWQIAYLEYKKYEYEHCYSRGTELPEYKEVINRLKKLQRGK